MGESLLHGRMVNMIKKCSCCSTKNENIKEYKNAFQNTVFNLCEDCYEHVNWFPNAESSVYKNIFTAFDYYKTLSKEEFQIADFEKIFPDEMSIKERLSLLEEKISIVQDYLCNKYGVNPDYSMDTYYFSPHTNISGFVEDGFLLCGSLIHQYDNEGSDSSEDCYSVFVDPFNEHLIIIEGNYHLSVEDFSIYDHIPLIEILKDEIISDLKTENHLRVDIWSCNACDRPIIFEASDVEAHMEHCPYCGCWSAHIEYSHSGHIVNDK